MNVRLLALPFAVVALLGTACGDEEEDSGAQAQSVDVQAFDFYFEETTVLLEPGAEATVTLTNNGETAHSFTVDDFDLEIEVDSGGSSESTFTVPDSPGAYDFYCKFHPDEMQGVISVGGSDQPANEPADDPDEDDEDVDVDLEEDEDDDV